MLFAQLFHSNHNIYKIDCDAFGALLTSLEVRWVDFHVKCLIKATNAQSSRNTAVSGEHSGH